MLLARCNMDCVFCFVVSIWFYIVHDCIEGLDAVWFCKGLKLVLRRSDLDQLPLLFSLEIIWCSSLMLVTRVWYLLILLLTICFFPPSVLFFSITHKINANLLLFSHVYLWWRSCHNLGKLKRWPIPIGHMVVIELLSKKLGELMKQVDGYVFCS